MSKIVLDPTDAGYNLTKINNNFDKIEAEFQDKVLYRNNTSGDPNQMENDIDMNSNRIYNLPQPLADNEAARLGDIKAAISGSTASNITFSPYKTVVSTNVQAAMQEMIDDTEANVGYISGLSGRMTAAEADIIELQSAIGVSGGVTTVDNISGLRAVDATEHSTVIVKGYWLAGDKGGGTYVYDPLDSSSAEDGGLIFIGLNNARWKLKHNGSVLAQAFGARGDNTNDDRQYLQFAINACSAAKVTLLLDGQYVINSSLYYTHNTKIKGVTSTVKVDAAMTVITPIDYSFSYNQNILVNGAFTAFVNVSTDVKIGVAFEDFGIAPWSKVNTPLPNYHLPADYISGCNGIDLVNTSDALVRNVVGKCLGSLVFTSGNTRTCHRPWLDGLGGYSCNIFINFQGTGPDHCAADILITNVTMVRMCDITLSLGFVDGATVADCKFFQASIFNVWIHDSGFINVAGCTFFETGSDNVFFERCTQVNVTGTIITRAGWYTYPLFSVQRDNLKIHFCNEVMIQAHLERASGYNYVVRDSDFVKLDILSYDPRVGAGNAHDAVIERSTSVELQTKTRNVHTYTADCGSVNIINSIVTGRIVSDPPWAFIASDTLVKDSPRGAVLHHRLPVNTPVGPGGSTELARVSVPVPPGYVLRAYNFQFASDVPAGIRLNTYFSGANTTATAVIPKSDPSSVLYDNRFGGGVGIAVVVMFIYNPGAGAITVGSGSVYSGSVYLSVD